MDREDLAQCFDLPLSAVRVIVPYVGGGYGSKSYTKIEPLTAALALRAGRPVRLALSVEESILTGRSVPARIHLATAFDGDGRIRGRRAKLWLNSGAYTDNTGRVAGRAARRLDASDLLPDAAPGGRQSVDPAALRMAPVDRDDRRRGLAHRGDHLVGDERRQQVRGERRLADGFADGRDGRHERRRRHQPDAERADAAGAAHRNGQARAGDERHARLHNRNLDGVASRQPRLQHVGLLGVSVVPSLGGSPCGTQGS
jgi:hypothetical protein